MKKKKIHSSSSSDSCSSDEEVAQPIPSSSDEPTDSDESTDSSDQEVAEPIPSKNTKASRSGRKRSIKNNTDPKLAKKLKVKVEEEEEEENGNPNGINTLPLVDSSLMTVTTSADVKEYQKSFVFEMDLPGLKSGDITVEIEDDNVVVITGERKREEEGGGVKYLNMDQRRRFGKLSGRFLLPENANADAVSAVCRDGVLSVTALKKLPPPQNPNKPRRTIEVVRIA